MIRTARADEIPNIYPRGDAERDANNAAALARQLKAGTVKPEWCFLAEIDGRVAGSIVLWTIPGKDVPTDFIMLDTDWEHTPEIGQTLLDHAIAESRKLGANDLGYCLDASPEDPQQTIDAEIRGKLLCDNGFKVTRDGRRWEWCKGDSIPEPDNRLTWRSQVDIGEEPFLTLLTEVLADTKDSLFLADVAEYGVRGAAEELWKESLDMEHEDSWYEIGFDADGNAAAVSLPGRNPTMAVIGFVGVSPKHRGKGYAASVIVRSTKILAEAGAEAIRGDCDNANVGMVRGFERGGFRNFTNRKEFKKQLNAAN